MKIIKKFIETDLNGYSCLHLCDYSSPNDTKGVVNLISQRFRHYVIFGKGIDEEKSYLESIRKTIKFIGRGKINFDEFIREMKLLSFYRMRKYYSESKKKLKVDKKFMKKSYLLSVERDRIMGKKYEEKTPYNQGNYRINYYIKDDFKRYFQGLEDFNRNPTIKFFKENKRLLKLPLHKINYPKKQFNK